MTTISNNDIARAIYLSTLGKTDDQQATLLKRTTKFLARHRLLGKSQTILTQLGKVINAENGIVEAKVFSAETLTDKVKKNLIQILTKRYSAKGVTILEKIDEKLLGGVRIEVNDEVLDMTLKNKVGKLKEYLIEQE